NVVAAGDERERVTDFGVLDTGDGVGFVGRVVVHKDVVLVPEGARLDVLRDRLVVAAIGGEDLRLPVPQRIPDGTGAGRPLAGECERRVVRCVVEALLLVAKPRVDREIVPDLPRILQEGGDIARFRTRARAGGLLPGLARRGVHEAEVPGRAV